MQATRRILYCVALWQLTAGAASIHREGSTFRVDGAASQGELKIFAAGSSSGMPAILGKSHFENRVLIFTPRFALQPGMKYRAVYREAGKETMDDFEIPKPDASTPASVLHVFPTTPRWPENQLKFYIQFSAPMSRGEAYRRLHLLDAAGAEVSLPFLELDQELWDRAGKRLTVLFDPGRVKTGLVPNLEAGLPLRAGRAYTLVIDREWLDAEGNPLAAILRKPIEVGPADRESPLLSKWRVAPPPAASTQPLTVDFPEPLDRALLDRTIEVIGPSGRPIAGEVTVEREETRWLLTPREAWQPGDYTLMVGTTLEDLAGNSILKPFEVDTFERAEERLSKQARPLQFRITASPVAAR